MAVENPSRILTPSERGEEGYRRPEIPVVEIDDLHKRKTPTQALARQALREQIAGATEDAARLGAYPREVVADESGNLTFKKQP